MNVLGMMGFGENPPACLSQDEKFIRTSCFRSRAAIRFARLEESTG